LDKHPPIRSTRARAKAIIDLKRTLTRGWPSDWRHFYEEIILARIDGSVVRRLAHHRSRSAEYYWAESRAAISRDGRDVVFHFTPLPFYRTLTI
jgi:hypothetical protein